MHDIYLYFLGGGREADELMKICKW